MTATLVATNYFTKEFIVQNLINAISLGSFYALIALGMAVIFGIMRLVNFAHGELLMVGGYALVLFAGPPWPVMLVVTILVVIGFALAMERAAFRPVREASPATLLVTSFAVSFLLQNTAQLVMGPLPKTTNVSNTLIQSWKVGFVFIAKRDVLTIIVTFTLLVLLGLFLARTRLGVEMRAAAEDFRMARLLGVRANRVIAASFAIAGVLAGVASFLLVAQTGTVTPTMGLGPVLVGFVAIVLGGMGSLRGAVIGGFLLGVITVTLQAYLPINLNFYRDAFVYGTVIAVIPIRPQGIIVPRSARTRI
jgi:branched-chain amino acid transport system permease protein